jgi:hypothetical protein
MRRVVLSALLVLPLVAVGCRKKEVTAYRVPKEKDAPAHFPGDGHDHSKDGTAPSPKAAPAAQPPAGGDMAKTPVPTASGPALAWVPPAHWQSKPAGAMRRATYTIAGEGGAAAEMAITAFPGDVGGEVANVNRWRGQLQLAPQSDADAAAAVTRLESNGLKIGFVELVNPNAATPTRVLGAFVPHAGSTWFFKLSGADSLVAKEKPAFLEFLKSLRPAPAQ